MSNGTLELRAGTDPRRHPLALCYAAGAALTGLAYAVQVLTGAVLNPILELQGEWAQLLWAGTYLVGGALGTYGILERHPPSEAAGFALLAAAVSISVAIQAFTVLNYVALVSGGSIALGAGLRSYLVSRG
jgi:hypothetical protein